MGDDALPLGFVTCIARVRAAHWISSRRRRLTIVDESLAQMELGEGPAPAVRLLIPAPGHRPHLPTVSPDGLAYPDGVVPPTPRTFTIRRLDRASRSLLVDIVTGHDGLGARWAATAEPGAEVGVAGPKTFAPLPAAEHLVLLGDETAIPAIETVLEDSRWRSSNLTAAFRGADGNGRSYRGRVHLILVRHGEAHAGFHGPIAGEKGCRGLTEFGRKQAEALRDHLAGADLMQADVLMSSTLRRAVETAQIIASGVGLELSDQRRDLCEVLTGEADGMEWSEYAARYGSFDMEAEPDRVFAPGGDSWNSFHERVRSTLARLVEEHEGKRVVAVCHAGVIMASMRVLLGVPHPGNGTQMRPTNTGLTEWGWDSERQRWTLHTFNDSGHLLELPEPTHTWYG
ncbi:MAG: hypothetical protein GX643_15520 [Acidimicrobiales bacterium]|nr:hypothetical protein [Acidimicrobiales bacterium]